MGVRRCLLRGGTREAGRTSGYNATGKDRNKKKTPRRRNCDAEAVFEREAGLHSNREGKGESNARAKVADLSVAAPRSRLVQK